ncbi:MAG: DUF362 domain-containing protein [Firmicutes bacterium]|nr:DUF362 domain-containing protein [Bacillota bacterium]
MNSRLHVVYTDSASLELIRPILAELPQPPKNARITFKPNLVVAKPSSSGATTDPTLVACIVQYLQEAGYRDIRIAEGSWVGERNTNHAYRICGYEEISRKYNVPLIDLKRDKARKVEVDGLEIEVCEEILTTDFLINMPVLKAHCQTRITCALKNLKGCIPDREKRRFHTLGLHRPIAALGSTIKSGWVIVDGIIGDLTFEEGGTPIRMDKIIIGTDPVLVDAYAIQLMGYELQDVPYVTMAAHLGAGSADLSKAEIIEHGQKDTEYIPQQPANRIAERYNSLIDQRQACSSCYASLIYALWRYEQLHGRLPAGVSLAIGQGFKGKDTGYSVAPTANARQTYGIGSCTARVCSHYVRGCPPSAKEVLTQLEDWLK